jgi:putative Mn2+ efflux pump MntP
MRAPWCEEQRPNATPSRPAHDARSTARQLGIGISIFAVGVVGLFAACDSKQRVCTLYVFGFLTLSMIVATAIVGALSASQARAPPSALVAPAPLTRPELARLCVGSV